MDRNVALRVCSNFPLKDHKLLKASEGMRVWSADVFSTAVNGIAVNSALWHGSCSWKTTPAVPEAVGYCRELLPKMAMERAAAPVLIPPGRVVTDRERGGVEIQQISCSPESLLCRRQKKKKRKMRLKALFGARH